MPFSTQSHGYKRDIAVELITGSGIGEKEHSLISPCSSGISNKKRL